MADASAKKTKNAASDATAQNERRRKALKRARIWKLRKEKIEFWGLMVAILVLFTQCAYDVISYTSMSDNRDTAQRQLRAYIGIMEMRIVNPIEMGLPNGGVFIQLKNFGQTPADDVNVRISCQIVTNPTGSFFGPLPPDFDFIAAPPHRNMDDILYKPVFWRMEPGDQAPGTMRFDNTMAQVIADTKMNGITIWIYGEIKYTDIYKKVTHIRKYCGFYVKDADHPVYAGPYNGEEDVVLKAKKE